MKNQYRVLFLYRNILQQFYIEYRHIFFIEMNDQVPISWDNLFMGIALLSAKRSRDPSTKVGACIVDNENKIVSLGYNGFPKGFPDDQMPWERISDDPLELKYTYVVHAEINAILNRNSNSVKNCTLYTTLFPCNECTKLIIQSGIRSIVYNDDKYHNTWQIIAAKKMLDIAGITYRRFIQLSI